MKLRSQLLALTLFFLLGAGFAQQRAIPSIKISNIKDEYLKLSKLMVKVRVVENIACTTMEMSFFNNTNRVLEGELNFPLTEGETVSRFAMEINGALREGVVVDKEKGTEVFESIIRRGVDPGLLEMTKGNNFKARVYPIPANGYKRIVVAYEHELKSIDNQYLYLLPLNFKDTLSEFAVHVEVLSQEAQPIVSNNEFISLQFTKQQTLFVSDFTQRNFAANKQLGFAIPKQENSKSTLTFKGTVDSTSYFYINTEPKKESREKIKPQQIALYYDVSASSQKRDLKKEFELLDNYFQWLSNVKVQVITFANAIETNNTYKVKNGNWQSIKTLLQNIVPDGGTQLGALDFNTSPCDEVLLFSDALSNYGKERIALSKTPVITINSNASADHSYLNYLAQKTAGYYLNLTTLTTKEALQNITHQNIQFLFAQYSESEVSELFPNNPTHFTGSFSIAGKINAPQATITLHFGYGDQTSFTKEYNIDNRNPISNNLVERIWVQKKITELNTDYEKNKAEITAMGKRFGVITKTTSLIVLDNLSDYLRYQIVPPADMQQAYYAQLTLSDKDKKADFDRRLDLINTQFQAKVQWWETDFQKIIREKREQAIRDSIQAADLRKKRTRRQDAGGEFRIYSGTYKLISGTIIDKLSGTPIPGVTITIKNTSTGTLSNLDGEFQISVPENALMLISFMGYKTVIIDYTAITTARITMTEDVSNLDDVIVIGYGSQTESDEESASSVSYDREASAIHTAPQVRNTIRYTPPVIRSDEMVQEQEEVQSSTQGTSKSNSVGNQESNSRRPTIALSTWEPKAAYLDSLKKSSKKTPYATYLTFRESYAQTPSFFLDVATYLYAKGEKRLAIKVLSNLAEMDLQNHEILRLLGRKLLEFDEVEASITIFKKVQEIRSFEPHSYRDLGLAYAENKQYQLAIETLYQVITKEWSSDVSDRFSGIESIVIGEINAIIIKGGKSMDTNFIDSRFLKNLPVDIRIVLNWDADNSDMDLWVTDPQAEKCDYSNNRTHIGGYMSRDMTRGYGPEEFLLRKADDGNYNIEVNYYGSTQQTLSGPVTLQALLYTNFGKKNEERKQITLRLAENKEVLKVGILNFQVKP